ncbi:hypothetical protein FRB91_008715, partial [Serendipita sp. 411]
LVIRPYGLKVHHHLASLDLAPTLFGTSKIAGAPLAIAMEYLHLSSEGVPGWASLYDRTVNRGRQEIDCTSGEGSAPSYTCPGLGCAGGTQVSFMRICGMLTSWSM